MSVCPHVALQAALLIEAPAAGEAAVRFLPGVNSQMPLEVAGALEDLAAVRADEASFRFGALKVPAGPLLVVTEGGAGFTWHQEGIWGSVGGLGAQAVGEIPIWFPREEEGATGGFDMRWEQLGGAREGGAAETFCTRLRVPLSS